jgi:hypothetical protein
MLGDCLENAVRILQKFNIGESQDIQSIAPQVLVPPNVSRPPTICVMLAAIEFYGKLCFDTQEVKYVLAKGSLSSEF